MPEIMFAWNGLHKMGCRMISKVRTDVSNTNLLIFRILLWRISDIIFVTSHFINAILCVFGRYLFSLFMC